jgi:hypothetical protein
MSNAFEPEWQGERGGDGFAGLAAAAGSQRLGASIVELASGRLNTSSEACRLLCISEMNFPDVVSYPDTGTTLAVTAPTTRVAFPSGSDGPLTSSMNPFVGGIPVSNA